MQRIDDVYYWLRATMQERATQHQNGEASYRIVEAYAEMVLEQISNMRSIMPVLNLPEA
jgi:hypothetical protein